MASAFLSSQGVTEAPALLGCGGRSDVDLLMSWKCVLSEGGLDLAGPGLGPGTAPRSTFQ